MELEYLIDLRTKRVTFLRPQLTPSGVSDIDDQHVVFGCAEIALAKQHGN